MSLISQDERPPAVELHFHLLPGVDDGPDTMADSLELARLAVEQGTGTVVATPHVRRDFVTDVWELPGRVAELRAALARENVPLTVLCGGEIGHAMVGRLGQAELELLAQGPADGRWRRPSWPSALSVRRPPGGSPSGSRVVCSHAACGERP